jgi:hypothetical protein
MELEDIITVFARARHWFLIWAKLIPKMSLYIIHSTIFLAFCLSNFVLWCSAALLHLFSCVVLHKMKHSYSLIIFIICTVQHTVIQCDTRTVGFFMYVSLFSYTCEWNILFSDYRKYGTGISWSYNFFPRNISCRENFSLVCFSCVAGTSWLYDIFSYSTFT